MEQAPKTIAAIQPFLEKIVSWAVEHTNIQAVGLVGSYAQGKAKQTSDIDLVLLVDAPGKYLAHPGWIDQFGSPVRQSVGVHQGSAPEGCLGGNYAVCHPRSERRRASGNPGYPCIKCNVENWVWLWKRSLRIDLFSNR